MAARGNQKPVEKSSIYILVRLIFFMNHKFVWLPAKKRAKALVALSLMAIALSVVIVACQKTADASLPVSQSSFNPAYVKEWYYGTFKKSAEWASSNTKTKKLPDWNHPTVGKIGDFEAIEYPLVKVISAFSIAGGATTSPDMMRKIANASLSKIVFIKDKNNKVQVREIDYIPEWQYLQKKGFDISDVSMVKDKKGFSGSLRINKWDAEPISLSVIEKGTIIKIGNSKKESHLKANSPEIISGASDDCTGYEYCTWERQCIYHTYGDLPSVLECGEWYNTGICWTEYVCGGDLDPCALYGLNCPGADDDCSNVCQEVSNALSDVQVISEDIDFNITPIDALKKHKNPRWRILKNLTWSLYSQEEGVIKLVDPQTNKWQWESLQHNSISKEGFTVGGTIAYTQGVGTPSFTAGTPNILYAGMSVNVSVTYSPACDCGGANVIIPSFTKNYTSNAIWSAQP
jgi:hypothetical protein